MCIKDKVMECKEKNSFMFCDRILINCLRCCGQFMKYSSCLTLVVYFVPFVLSDIGWPRRLTFDSIFNDTNYVHLQHKVRPYPLRDAVNYTVLPSGPQVLEEGYNENELDYEDEYRDSRVQEPLLIGFARDPFRYSVPEEDYLKGVRNMNPKTIMSKGENRGKRGVLHLYNMVYCATGCNPASYLGYGCYCGFLGEGRPTDGIDRCCQIHDECYAHLYCPLFTVYLQPYYWRCHRGQPLCALENYNTRHQFISGCAARLCECDRKFAMCVKNYRCPRKRALCRSSPIRLLQNLLLFG